ncbi:hypothetical protein [Vibrio cincinnatiensis]|uniref:hypothetical protein n=1 Tax=Vibrio cincinnatiensis TaxID=675 RepID=UPI001EDECDB6|nr:hypothetical protein [Vibrio cincinnatiensis]
MNKLERIKNERKKLEIMLLNKSNNCAADEVYQALKPYFDAVDNMNSYHPIPVIIEDA